MGERIKHELLHDPRPSLGRASLVIGLICGLFWLLLHYAIGTSWSGGRFLAAAVCFGFWGAADVLPRGLQAVAPVLRAAGWIFLLGLVLWVVMDVIVG